MRKLIPIILIVIVILLVAFKPYIVFYKYESQYTDVPNRDNLFELCNVATSCYDYYEFYKYAKLYLDENTPEHIEEYYHTNTTEACEIYDTLLADFLVKSIVYEHISETELSEYFSKFNDDGFFGKVMWHFIEESCNSKKDLQKIDDHLNIVIEDETLYRDKMVVYVLRTYIYEELGDEQSLQENLDKMNVIKDEYYKEKEDRKSG